MKRVLPDNQVAQKRKKDHLDLVLSGEVDFLHLANGFEQYRFVHQALPELDLDCVNTSTSLLGHSLSSPIVISSMVGGLDEARALNRNLAVAAQELGLAMGVGSQRCGIDDPEVARSYSVRDVAPDILLFANLGAVQLNYGYTSEHCRRAIDMIGADALILHLNPLQEALQPEGNTNFGGLLNKIETLCRALDLPVFVKEVGFGISEQVAAKLAEAGISGIDVAGAGGTSFSRIEVARRQCGLQEDAFSSWGITTAESLTMVRKATPGLPVIASGGIRSGVDTAKAIALGANAVGIGAPLLRRAQYSASEVVQYLNEMIGDLRIAMFCVGCSTIAQLRGSSLLVSR